MRSCAESDKTLDGISFHIKGKAASAGRSCAFPYIHGVGHIPNRIGGCACEIEFVDFARCDAIDGIEEEGFCEQILPRVSNLLSIWLGRAALSDSKLFEDLGQTLSKVVFWEGILQSSRTRARLSSLPVQPL